MFACWFLTFNAKTNLLLLGAMGGRPKADGSGQAQHNYSNVAKQGCLCVQLLDLGWVWGESRSENLGRKRIFVMSPPAGLLRPQGPT